MNRDDESAELPAGARRTAEMEDRGVVVVLGASGFIGRALVPALARAGYRVRAAARQPERGAASERTTWHRCDAQQYATLAPVFEGARCVFHLVHAMTGGPGYAERDRRAARNVARAAAEAGVGRIVYLGGVAPSSGRPSPHLASRLEVGAILRAGPVRALELRASMIVGPGSTSWQVVRDLALRLPAMILPAWLRSRSCPVALDDVVEALVRAVDTPLAASAWFDLPGPDTLRGVDILEHIAALDGRTIPALMVPVLTPRLSALWLHLVTRADYAVASELVAGLASDLLPRDESFWHRVGHPRRLGFDEAASRALRDERASAPEMPPWLRAEERLVRRLGRREAARHPD
jgi:uncharacterized protein YbjT (DUF2867 family)